MNSGKTLETRLLCRVSLWSLDAQYYYCIYVVHVSPVMLCAYNVMYRWCCVHVVYAVLCTDDVVCMLDMWCCVHMVLCTYGVVCMLYMWCYVHMAVCA